MGDLERIELALYRVASRLEQHQISEPLSRADVLRAVADEIAVLRSQIRKTG